VDRRQFLQALGALGATGAGLIGVASGAQASDAGAADGAGRLPLTKKRRPAQPAVRDVDGLPVAEWVVEENRRPGTLDWVIHPVALPAGALPGYGTGVEGYVDKVSYQAGDILTLFAPTSIESATTAVPVHATCIRPKSSPVSSSPFQRRQPT